MINISGHLREERKITGYYDQDVPLIVNCCGKQVFQTPLTDTSYLVKRLSLMRTVLSVILPVVRFFSEVPAGYNPVGRQGKDDFPT